ncbi:sulfotransferase 6B1-like [Glandiceps talaboti]
MAAMHKPGFPRHDKEPVIDGMKFPKIVFEETIRRIKTMEVRDNDIWLMSYPKTGTHWMKGILYQLFNYDTPEGRGEKEGPHLEDYVKFAEFPEFATGKPMLDKIITMPSEERRFIATHLQPCHTPNQFFEKKPKAIHIMRNPKDTAVSLWHFTRDNPGMDPIESWEAHLEGFLQGNVAYGSHADYVTSWWNLRNEIDMLYVTFEDMKKDLKGSVMKIAKFLEVDLTEESAAIIAERCTFSSMKAKTTTWKHGGKIPTMFRKGVAGGWKTSFTVAQSEQFDAFFDEKFKDLDFKFQYE